MQNARSSGESADLSIAKKEIQDLVESVYAAEATPGTTLVAVREAQKNSLKDRIKALSVSEKGKPSAELFNRVFGFVAVAVRNKESALRKAATERAVESGKKEGLLSTKIIELDGFKETLESELGLKKGPQAASQKKVKWQDSNAAKIFLAVSRLLLPFITFLTLPYHVYKLFTQLGKKGGKVETQLPIMIEGMRIAAGFMQVIPIIFLVAALAFGTGPFAPLLALGLPILLAVTAGFLFVTRGLGAAVMAVVIKIALRGEERVKDVSVLGTFFGFGLVGESLPDVRKLVTSKGLREQPKSVSDIALNTLRNSVSVSDAGKSAESTSLLSKNSPRSSLSIMRKLSGDSAAYSPEKKESIVLKMHQVRNLDQLVQEAGCNYLSYTKNELNNTQTRLEAIRDSTKDIQGGDADQINQMLPKLFERIEQVKRIDSKAKELGMGEQLREKKDHLTKVVKSSIDPDKTSVEMDAVLTAFEKELDGASLQKNKNALVPDLSHLSSPQKK